MLKGLGIDIIPLDRISRWMDRYADETLGLVFTGKELQACRRASRPERYFAICFAGKEAVGKALGTGLAGIAWNEIEIAVRPSSLDVALSGNALRQAAEQGIRRWTMTRSHTSTYVCVVAIAE